MAGVWDGDDHVGLHRRLPREASAHLAAGDVHGPAVQARVLIAQRKFAERVVRWDLDTNVRREMAYNHYFGKGAKPAAKKS